jgi:hypothetical protein
MFEDEIKPKSRSSKYLIIAFAFAALIVGGAIVFLLLRPTVQDVENGYLEGAYREGSPEFEKYTKGLVIETNENSALQSPTALGTIVMLLGANLKNYTGKTIVGLEIRASVIDQKGNTVRDKTVIVVPKQQPILSPDEKMYVNVRIDGFTRDDDRADVRWKVTAIKFQ